MQPFELPEFYMPWPARLNPNLEAARVHSKAWAAGMGMLDSEQGAPGPKIWDEAKFDAMDYALLCSYTHPDAPGPELDLVTDWYVWVFYFDDHFLETYKRSRDLAGAKEYLDRLPAFMPVYPTSTFPEPTNPVERGLADLWIRTASPMSIDQRRQFRQGVEDMTTSWLWELANHIQHRIPDPVDYVEMRRETFGSDLTMSLARITQAGGIPAQIFCTRAMRGLENSATDYVCLMNDIFSYQKEIEFEGELNNGVLVVQKFLGIDRKQAVLVVNDLMTSRLLQFEHIIATELPLLVGDFNLDADAREALHAYVVGLQDWVAGILDWHRLTGRYDESALRRRYRMPTRLLSGPTGLGTSAARIGSLCGTGGSGSVFGR